MARQARILDFEEVKSSSSSRTRNRQGSSRSGQARSGSGRGGTRTGSAGRTGSGSRAAAGGRSGSASRSGARSTSRSNGRAASHATGAQIAGRASSGRTASASRGAGAQASAQARGKAGSAKSVRATSSRSSARTKTQNTRSSKSTSSKSTGTANAARSASNKNSFASKLDAFKRGRAKKKTDQLFATNVGADAPAEDAPRAALYKAKMGASHKKSTKMQREQKEGKTLRLPQIPGLNRRRATVLVALLCVVASCAFLYTPAKNYYVAQREQARAQVAYELVTTRNQALLEDVALLSSDAGMEDRVREQYGWVKEGENAVIVKGLSDDGSQSAADVLQTTALADVVAPETWYSPVLDRVFGYGA